jgi:adenylate cyclase class 2
MKHRQSLETEVKLRIPTVEAMRPLLTALGFQLRQGAALEQSTLWDRGGELRAKGSALRTRRYAGEATFTFKGPKVPDDLLKIRPEFETAVADPEALEALLAALGYVPALRMEKTREVWAREELIACLDDTPFGPFLELEGDAQAIKAAMEHLALDASRIERRSYPTLWREAGLGAV